MAYDYKILIRESHLDTFGHVNNAVYLTLFEEARWEFITKNGYGLRRIQETKQGPVILDVTIKFLKELRLREEIVIRSETVNYNGKVGQIKQVMLKPDGAVACEAYFTFGLFDTQARRLIDPTDEWKKAVGIQ
jgi:acyl-CoA thioester hydrolase